MSLSRRMLLLLFLVVLVFIILEIWSVNRLSSFGSELSRIEQAKANLTLQNDLLEAQIAESSSLNQASKMAGALGFQNIKDIQYLSLPQLAFGLK